VPAVASADVVNDAGAVALADAVAAVVLVCLPKHRNGVHSACHGTHNACRYNSNGDADDIYATCDTYTCPEHSPYWKLPPAPGVPKLRISFS